MRVIIALVLYVILTLVSWYLWANYVVPLMPWTSYKWLMTMGSYVGIAGLWGLVIALVFGERGES